MNRLPSVQNIKQSIYIDSHTHSYKSNCSDTYETICHPSDEVSASSGIHPWELSNLSSSQQIHLIETLDQYPLIGECGLDRFIDTDFQLQLRLFKAHLQHAYQYTKTCVIHCVKSESDLLQLRKSYKNNWFIHGFFGNTISMHQFLKMNTDTWFGFGHQLFDSEKLQKTLIECPIEHILLETDSQNKYKIEDIYKKVCKLKKINLEHLVQSLQINYLKCFQIK